MFSYILGKVLLKSEWTSTTSRDPGCPSLSAPPAPSTAAATHQSASAGLWVDGVITAARGRGLQWCPQCSLGCFSPVTPWLRNKTRTSVSTLATPCCFARVPPSRCPEQCFSALPQDPRKDLVKFKLLVHKPRLRNHCSGETRQPSVWF